MSETSSIGEIAQGVVHHVAATGTVDLRSFTADAVWWTMLTGVVPIADQATSMKATAQLMFSGPGRFEIDLIITGNNAVAIQARGFQPLKNGKSYDNVYAWVITFRGGLISRVNAYFNPEIARSAFTH